MRLMILENRRLITTLQAGQAMLSIGSSPECGVHLPDPKLSAHQASLTQDPDGSWWLEVVDPAIPTCLNRSIQKGRARLKHADEIQLGIFSIRLFMESSKTREELLRERMQSLVRRHLETLPLGAIIHKSDDPVQVPKECIEQLTLLALRLEQAESVPELITPLLRALLRMFEARRAWIGVRRTDESEFEWTLGLAGNGQPCDRPPFAHQMESRCMGMTQCLCVPEASPIDVRSAMAVPLVCQTGNLGMIYLENDKSDEAWDEAAINALSAVACGVSRPLENILHRIVAKRRQAVSTEQTIARQTQDAVTPKALPVWDELLLAAYRHMGALRVCDSYDVVQLRDRTASLLLARVNAQGEALSRCLAGMRAAFRSSSLYSEPPHLFLRALNWIIGEGGPTIDLASVWVSPESGKVQYCLAGSGVRLGLVQSDGTCERLESSESPSIGQTRTPIYASQSLVLQSGDTLVAATEGVNAIKNPQGEVFGWARLREQLCDGLGDTPSKILSELEADLREFSAGVAGMEDFSVVLVNRR